MTRGILIAGNESSLGVAIAAEAAKRVEHFATAFIPNRLSERAAAGPAPAGKQSRVPPGEPSEAAIPLQWNPGSPVAARALILAAENRLEHIDEAILVCTPPAMRRRAAELLPADIEILANDHVKGWFFLARELARIFREKQSGTLALVLSDMGSMTGKGESADLLGPPASAAFRAFAHSLLSSAFDEPYLTIGFSSSEIGEEGGFAAFIFKIIDEGHKRNNGKWHKYGKLNLFR